MKRIIFISMVFMLAAASWTVNAQQTDAKAERQAAKAEKKARKEAEKQLREAAMEVAFQQALQALEAKEFVLEAERVEFRRGTTVNVSPTTNFVAVSGDQASIQLNSGAAFAGPNGIGGITVDGRTSDIEMRTDKKGNVIYSMGVNGAAVSASVSFILTKGSNRCSVTVSPNFNSNRITFTGRLVPGGKSRVFKGNSI